MAQVGVVYVDVQFDTSQVGANLQKTLSGAVGPAAAALDSTLGAKLSNFGTNATRVGRQVSFGISAPLLAIGTSAVEGFSKFESSMTKIETLVGESHAQVQDWSKDVRRIGVDFGVGAQEAADALYFITSSGLSGAQAIDALQVSAKASAVGLGDMKTIADLLTSALNAYGKSGLTATKAIDSLLIAIRLGKNEPTDLAASMGRVFPIASKLGVTFQELAGAFAALSLNGTDADEAATQLRGILNSMLDPSKQARDQLAAVGLSIEGLQDSLSSKGLLPTLQLMRDRFGDSSSAMAETFGNVRALTGVFTLLGSSEAQVADIMRQTKNATGELDRALDIVRETTEFKLNKAMASLKDSLMDVGQSAAPVAQTLANAGAGMARGFSALPSVLQTTVAGLGAFGIAAGPVIYSVGSLASLAGGFRKSWEAAFPSVNGLLSNYGAKVTRAADGTAQVTTAAQRLGPAVAGIGVAVGGAVVAWSIWNDKMNEAQQHAEALGNLFTKKIAKGGIDDARATIDRTRKSIADLTTEVDNSHALWDADYRAELEKYKDQLNGEIAATEKRITLSQQMSKATGADANALFEWLNTEAAAGRAHGSLSAAMDEFLRQQREGKSAVQVHTTALGQQQKSITQLKDAYFGVQSAERAFKDAQDKIVQAQRGQVTAARALDDAYRNQRDAQDKVVDAERRREDSLHKLASAQEQVADAQRALNDALAGPSPDEALNIDSAQLGLEEARRRLDELGKAKPGEKPEAVDPLDRRRAELDVRRAQMDLERAQAANAERAASAEDDLRSAQEGVTQAQADAEESNKAIAQAHQAVADAAIRVEDAQLGVTEADKNLQRAHEDLVPAADVIATKQQAWADALFASNGQIAPLIAYLEALKALYPEVAGQLQAYIDKLKSLSNPSAAGATQPPAYDNRPAPVNTADPEYQALLREAEDLQIPGARLMTKEGLRAAIDAEKRKAPSNRYKKSAYGNWLGQGELSSVNERGMPELFEADGQQYLIPLTGGRVVPLEPSTIPVKGNDGGVQFGDINVTTTKDPEPTAYAIRRGLRAEMFLQGKQR